MRGPVVAVTGHRPTKLGGYDTPNPTYTAVRAEVRAKLRELKPFMVLTGMALGFDQWVAEICIEEEIPFCACIPFEGQEKKWPKRSQERYRELLAKARVRVVVNEGGYTPGKMHARNHFMVDNSDVLIAAWNGDEEGGTFKCVEYANKVGREVLRLEWRGES